MMSPDMSLPMDGLLPLGVNTSMEPESETCEDFEKGSRSMVNRY